MYRVKLLFDCRGPNPDFDPRRPPGPDNPPDRTVPAGTLLEHPDAWQHCLPDAAGLVRAEPADAATSQKVAQAQQRRDAVLSRLSPRQLKARAKLQEKLAHLGPDSVESPESRVQSPQPAAAEDLTAETDDAAGEAQAADTATADDGGSGTPPRKAARKSARKAS